MKGLRAGSFEAKSEKAVNGAEESVVGTREKIGKSKEGRSETEETASTEERPTAPGASKSN